MADANMPMDERAGPLSANDATTPGRRLSRWRHWGRRLAILFIPVTLICLAGAGIYYGRRLYAWRQISGPLTFDAARLPTDPLTLGEFMLTWSGAQGGALTVRHTRQPDKILWSSLPGRSFVAAARGVESVEEERGMFFFSDRLLTVCARTISLR